MPSDYVEYIIMTQGLDILIVDDEPIICSALKKILQKQNHRVTVSCSGREAMRHIESESFHCAFIDLRLPDMEGIDLPPRMLSRNPDMTFILTSTDSFIESSKKFKNIPSILSCEEKPLDFSGIVKLLRILERSSNETITM